MFFCVCFDIEKQSKNHFKNIYFAYSVRVDRVCHTLVQTRQRFGICPVEMRKLSLTVAVIERAMYAYGRQQQEHKAKSRRIKKTRIHRQPQPGAAMYPTRPISTVNTPSINAMNVNNMSPNLMLPTTMNATVSAPNYTLDTKSGSFFLGCVCIDRL